MDLALREKIASEVLGILVAEGDAMPCRFGDRHSKSNGARDMKVCLKDDGGRLPTFFCFHSSCDADWAPLNKELRSKIWYAEKGIAPRSDSGWNSGRGGAPEPRGEAPGRRVFDPARLRSLYREELGRRSLFEEKSPVAIDGCTAELFLEALYPEGEKVIIFTKFASQGQYLHWSGHGSFRLASRAGIKAEKAQLPPGGPEGVWFLCQPVTGLWYPNPRNIDEEGNAKLSRRSQEAVTDWRYLVLESDEANEAHWLSLLALLPLPIAAVYTSGGKSIHALVRVYARSKQEWDGIKRLMISVLTKLGADSGALSAVRLTRLPGCLRGNRPQELLYLNPDVDPGGLPICEL